MASLTPELVRTIRLYLYMTKVRFLVSGKIYLIHPTKTFEEKVAYSELILFGQFTKCKPILRPLVMNPFASQGARRTQNGNH